MGETMARLHLFIASLSLFLTVTPATNVAMVACEDKCSTGACKVLVQKCEDYNAATGDVVDCEQLLGADCQSVCVADCQCNIQCAADCANTDCSGYINAALRDTCELEKAACPAACPRICY